MAYLRVRTRHPLQDAMVAVTHGGALRKPPTVAAPGEQTVPSYAQTVTSAGTTPAQNVAVSDSVAAADPASNVTPAGIAGSVDFGSLTGSVSGHWLMWAAIAVGAYLIFRKG